MQSETIVRHFFHLEGFWLHARVCLKLTQVKGVVIGRVHMFLQGDGTRWKSSAGITVEPWATGIIKQLWT